MPKYYRIRLEWNNGKWTNTQKGAYLYKEQAIKECTEELIKQGYKVFDDEGIIIYPECYNKIAKQMLNDNIIEEDSIGFWSNIIDNDLLIESKYWADIITKYSKKIEYYKSLCDNKEDISNDSDTDIFVSSDNNYTIYKVPVSRFAIQWHDKPKRQCDKSTYINAGYFGNYKDIVNFTLPSGNLICDINENDIPDTVLKYLKERKIKDGKLYFPANQNSTDQFRGKYVSTLFVKDTKAYIKQLISIDDSMSYAISGFPIIKNGQTVSLGYAMDEGWDRSVLRATWHSIIGITDDHDYIYIGGIKTTTTNIVSAISEISQTLEGFNFENLLKLDGGGSAYCKMNGNEIYNTSENRQINNIITF